MTGIADRAAALLVEVEAERRRPIEDRATQASDADLDRVAAVLHAVMRPGRTDGGASLAGVVGHVVVDGWSLTSDLSNQLCAFDRDLKQPSR